jgi:phage tail sheath protein FI
VIDPEGDGTVEKLVSTTGMIQGYEAASAREFGGYQKPPAGTRAILSRITRLPTGKQPLNSEYLYPKGINTIELRDGQFVIWGNKTFTSNLAWSALQQRRLMSHYTNVLRENFNWAVFEINDRRLWGKLRTALRAYFFGEYAKRALDNTLPFESAVVIKIDQENNTPASLAAQDVNADLTLALPNSADRIKFSIGKLGILESEA